MKIGRKIKCYVLCKIAILAPYNSETVKVIKNLIAECCNNLTFHKEAIEKNSIKIEPKIKKNIFEVHPFWVPFISKTVNATLNSLICFR